MDSSAPPSYGSRTCLSESVEKGGYVMALFLFDLDDTLVRGYVSRLDKNYHAVELLLGRKERIDQLLGDGHTVAVVTNQRGAAFGYHTPEDSFAKFDRVRKLLGHMDIPFFWCFHHPKGKPQWKDPEQCARAKPSGAMIKEAMAEHPNAAADGATMIGNGKEDYEAAIDAGIAFQWTEDFFREGMNDVRTE